MSHGTKRENSPTVPYSYLRIICPTTCHVWVVPGHSMFGHHDGGRSLNECAPRVRIDVTSATLLAHRRTGDRGRDRPSAAQDSYWAARHAPAPRLDALRGRRCRTALNVLDTTRSATAPSPLPRVYRSTYTASSVRSGQLMRTSPAHIPWNSGHALRCEARTESHRRLATHACAGELRRHCSERPMF